MSSQIKATDTQFDILDHLPFGAFVLRQNFVVLFWNNSLEAWTGISREKIMGANIGDFFAHWQNRDHTGWLQSIFEGDPHAKAIVPFELQQIINPALPAEKETRWVVTAVPDRNGPEFFALFVTQDDARIPGDRAAYSQSLAEIKERYRQAEAKLKTYAADLQRSNRELQNFAYIASHDLQEPLRKILLFSNRLKSRQTGFDEQTLDYLNRMFNAASRMQALIQDLLEYSRLTTHGQPFEPVDLNKIASNVLSDVEVRIQESQAQVAVGLLPTIQADPSQIHQLLLNLIGNALKYFRPEAFPVISIKAKIKDGMCRLTVSDNGIGFDEEQLERIFRVFERLHGRGKYEGTGIGLAICRKIVERHGGEITATSTPGEGSTFIVTLPVSHNEG